MTAHQMNAEDQTKIFQLPGNTKCVDCERPNPEWASISLGVLMCLECSGRHRGLGTHISRVRSLAMDSWSQEQLQNMFAGGNEKCQSFLEGHSVDLQGSFASKYDCPPAELYRQVLKARVEGRPEPTEMPKPVEPAEKPKVSMTGFGSAPKAEPSKKNRRQKLAAVGLGIGSVAVAGWLASRKGRKSAMSRNV